MGGWGSTAVLQLGPRALHRGAGPAGGCGRALAHGPDARARRRAPLGADGEPAGAVARRSAPVRIAGVGALESHVRERGGVLDRLQVGEHGAVGYRGPDFLLDAL